MCLHGRYMFVHGVRVICAQWLTHKPVCCADVFGTGAVRSGADAKVNVRVTDVYGRPATAVRAQRTRAVSYSGLAERIELRAVHCH